MKRQNSSLLSRAAEQTSFLTGMRAMLELRPQEVHVWFARRIPMLRDQVEAKLCHAEWTHANSFRFSEDRLKYVFAHVMLRDVLRRYLPCRPADIRFSKNRFGKPFLCEVTGDTAPEFNLSHTGDLVLVALSQGGRVGIDAEEIRPIEDFLSIAGSYFTHEEFAFIGSQVPGKREREFLRCWTRKEAYLKAIGKGLSIPPNSFDTLISSKGSAVVLESGSRSENKEIWQLADLDVCEGYVAAVAIDGGMKSLVHFEWPSGDRRKEVTFLT